MLVKDVHIDKSAFQAKMAAYILSSGFVDSGKFHRPVFAVFMGSYTSIRPFIANAMLGKRIKEGKHESFEFLKSEGYKWTWQRHGEGVAVTAHLPEIFAVDPGMVDPKGIHFLFTLPDEYVRAQSFPEAPLVMAKLSCFKFPVEDALSDKNWHSTFANAYAFATYLDRRTRSPIIADPAFYVYLYLMAIEARFLRVTDSSLFYNSYSPHDKAQGLEKLGLGVVHKVYTSHTAFDEFLAEAVKVYFQGVR